jgi:hypothetical protein
MILHSFNFLPVVEEIFVDLRAQLLPSTSPGKDERQYRLI